jgi:hypothetical protein
VRAADAITGSHVRLQGRSGASFKAPRPSGVGLPPDGVRSAPIEDAVIERPTRTDRMTGRRLGRQEAQMTGTTRTIQQPANTGSILAVLGMTVVIAGAAVAMALASTSAAKSTQPVAAPAPLYAPAVRDLGIRDNTSVTVPAAGTFADHGWSETGSAGFGPKGDQLKDDLAVGSNQGASGYHGFGNPADRASTSANGSNGDAPAGRNLALRAQ